MLAQIAAEALGVPPAAFRLVLGDTVLTPDAGKTSASRQTFVSGEAARRAGEALRAAVLRHSNGEIGWDGDALTVNGTPFCPAEALEGLGRLDPPTVPLDADGQGTPYAT